MTPTMHHKGAERRRYIVSAGWFVVLVVALLLTAGTANAEQLAPEVTSDGGTDCDALIDDDFVTTATFGANEEITVSADEPISGLYIVWESVPGTWTLEAGGDSIPCGKEGFLHEYVQIPESSQAKRATIVLEEGGATIADVYAFSEGELPSFVQRWNPPYERADLLVVSTHPDDEVLFLGGVIPTYVSSGARVEVVYFTTTTTNEPFRNHELLNGLWVMGVTHYPQMGEFEDYYSDSYETALTQYDTDDCLESMVRTIRRFKPQVVVGQDIIGGEYGHGAHILCAKTVADAVDVAGDSSEFSDSADTYGTWDVPKTYFHLYPEGELEIDAREPLKAFDGETCLEVLRRAYKKHESQQHLVWTVEDAYDEDGNESGYQYPCTQFGLYRSLVGDDTQGKNDIFEHVVPYYFQGIISWISRYFN